MTKAELEALADRVLALDGPDDEIDAEIVEWAFVNRWPLYDGETINYDPALWLARYGFSPTSSIDDAMTLYVEVPVRVPSNPRAITASALRARASMMGDAI